MNNCKKDSSFHGVRGKQNLDVILVDLFVGATDTTVNSLNWALYYLCKDPTIQVKLFKELKSVTHCERVVSLQDRPKLPYLEAVVSELLRITSLGEAKVFRSLQEHHNDKLTEKQNIKNNLIQH